MDPITYSIQPNLDELFRENNTKLKNTAIAHLFLDKVVKLIDRKHPDHAELNSFGYGSSLYTSIMMIELLARVLPKLSQDEQSVIRAWIRDEKKYLPYVDKIDSWRSTPEMVKMFHKCHVERKEAPEIIVEDSQITRMAERLAIATSLLDRNDALKMIGGDSIHETRIIVRKKGTKYQLTYLDTNANQEYRLNAVDFTKDFWKAIIAQKLTPKKFDRSFFSHFGIGMILEGPIVKSIQQTRSCSAQAILADLKNHIIKSQHTVSFYKDLKKLLIKEVLLTEKENLNPTVVKYLEFRSCIIGLRTQAKQELRGRFASLVQVKEHDNARDPGSNATL